MSCTPSAEALGIRERRLVDTIVGNLNFMFAASFRPSDQFDYNNKADSKQ